MANAVQNTQQQLATHLQKMQAMMKAFQMNILQGLRMHKKIMEAVVTTVDTKAIVANKDVVPNVEEIDEAAVVTVSTGI